MITRYLAVIISIVIGFMSAAAYAAERDKDAPGFAREFDKFVDETVIPLVPGAALVVIADGEVKLLKSYGVREVNAEELVTPETVFRLASVSKTFAASAVGKLVADKVLDWDVTVRSRLNNITFKNPNYGEQITLKNILSQSTGLIPHAYTNLIEDNVPYDRIIRRLKEVDFVCAPGKCYSYQNLVFSLSADIVKSYTGIAYEDYVTKNLFAPLDMRNASFGRESFLKNENHAVPHVKRNGEWRPVKVLQNYYNVAPAAGVNASIEDMGQWILAQLGHMPEVLSESTLDTLHKGVIRTSRSQSHYGQREFLGEAHYALGWRIFDYGGHKDFVHHGGWVKGFRAEVVLNRELQIGMAFLTNSEAHDINDLVFKFLELYDNDRNEADGPMTGVNVSQLTPAP